MPAGDSSVPINSGSGTLIDTMEMSDGNHRQVIVIGDPTTIDARLAVDPTHGIIIQGGIAHGAADSGKPVKIGAKYSATLPTLTDGYRSNLYVDINGVLLTRDRYSPVAENNTSGVVANILKPVNDSAYSPTNGDNTYGTRVTKKLVKNAAGNVYSVQVFNFGTSLAYFQLHNKATVPLATETPLSGCSWPVPPGTATKPGVLSLTVEDFAPSNRHETGIGWALSSAVNVFTDSLTATDFVVNIRTV